MWYDVKHPRNPGRLLFRVDMDRLLIQVQDRGEKYTIDLSEFATQKGDRQQGKTGVSCGKGDSAA